MDAGGIATGRRRAKAALFLFCCGLGGSLPHGLGVWSPLPALALALALGGYGFKAVFLTRSRVSLQAATPGKGEPVAGDLPAVDLVVAARDEEAVIGRLVERLSQLDYPKERLRFWVVDDGSEDGTAAVLAEQQLLHPQLQVVRRPRNAGGGKSGALNTVLPQLTGRWLMVLDADADLQSDVLLRLVPFAEAGGWAAVQLRKAVVNAGHNLVTRCQAMEMALDAVIQEGRLQAGGVVELRGNGQLLRREAVLACDGFNEATVTDDLDLSFRLLLEGQPVGLLWNPPVQEEAVTSLAALWRQRQRWAEGGLQRFFDYWPRLWSEALPAQKRLDLAVFFLLQYGLPVMASADLLVSLLSQSAPAFWPLSLLAFGLSGGAILKGCLRPSEGPALPAMDLANLALGIFYLGHWFVVIPYTTLRMALLPKTLVWAKTLHVGASVEPAQAASAPGARGSQGSPAPAPAVLTGDGAPPVETPGMGVAGSTLLFDDGAEAPGPASDDGELTTQMS
ncbi:MAG: glycosyltransferase family 2 protein [Cyanobacteria bacterium]|nr:glycosyltransferase family 2 protein [Cyanobacteriota bacterium]